MRWLKAIIGEIFSLFVDDGSVALAIIVWVGVVWVVPPWLDISPTWRGVILAGGLAAILVDSVSRKARKKPVSVGASGVEPMSHSS
jgi:hypothetical protein